MKETFVLIFSVLSYNIHGLPQWIAGDHPERRMPLIVKQIEEYPIVFLQENFAYSAHIAKTLHPTILHGNASRLPSLFSFLLRPLCGNCGSGLTTLLNMPYAIVLAHEAHPFSVCSGWLRKKHDCFATKGFMRVRLRFANGAVVSVYNLHLDAGDAQSDRHIRARQCSSLAAHIKRNSSDGLIVAGDFNMLIHEIAPFISETGLSVCGTDTMRDYILSRSGGNASLVCMEGRKLTDFPRLSDHQPLLSRFAVSFPMK